LGSREFNNDSSAVLSWKHDCRRYYLAVVADGIGKNVESGHCAKAVVEATATAAKLFVQSRNSKRPFGASDCGRLRGRLAEQLGLLHGPQNHAATLAVALFSDRSALVAWAGDSRIYAVLSDGTLLKLTDDHHDKYGDISNFIRSNGEIHGAIEVRQYSMNYAIAAVGTTDGLHGYCSSNELLLFLIYCMANAHTRGSELACDLRTFLQRNLSDNATMAVVCKPKSYSRLSSMARTKLKSIREF